MIDKLKELTKNNLIHDFSLGALFAYHKLEDLIEEEKASIGDNFLVYETSKKVTLILYHSPQYVSDFIKFKRPDKKLEILSASPIISLGKYKKRTEECFYQLSRLTNKSYHQYRRPISIFEERPDLNIWLADIDQVHPDSLMELHNEWVKYKLSQPKTHRISFPTARYRRTLISYPIKTFSKAILIDGRLYGFIIFSVEGQIAFELSFCTLYWKKEFWKVNGLNQYIFSYCLIQLKKQGVKFINSGYALNKNLKTFKTCAQKADSVYRYSYEV